MALQYLDELTKSIQKKSKQGNVANDAAYIQSILKENLASIIGQYFTNGNRKQVAQQKLRIEIREGFVDEFLDLMQNDSINQSITVTQITPTVFELKLKRWEIF